jgi:hypothetical protein
MVDGQRLIAWVAAHAGLYLLQESPFMESNRSGVAIPLPIRHLQQAVNPVKALCEGRCFRFGRLVKVGDGVVVQGFG